MPTEIGIFEAKTHFSKIIDRVEAGEEIVVTRHGKPAVRIVSLAEPETRRWEEMKERVASLRQRTAARATTKEIVEWVREGRRDEQT